MKRYLIEEFSDSVHVYAEVLDTDTHTVAVYEYGVMVAERPATEFDLAALFVDRGLPADGKLATALAVLGLLPAESAAALVGLPAQALVDEALAWGVAGQA